MKPQFFISYSHKDDNFREEFQEHLSGLRRNGLIEDWTDRRILPGQDWEQEIDENLAKSQYVVFLLSPSFISSDYCMGVEMKTAIKMHNEGVAALIPIVVRPCDWSDFPIGKHQSPAFADPISSNTDRDQAWLNVVLELKELLSRNASIHNAVDDTEIAAPRKLTKSFGEWLVDTEVTLAHRDVSKVTLRDIFVPPDLKKHEADLDKVSGIISALNPAVTQYSSLIFGDEQSGKTTLCKQLFVQLYDEGASPLYVNGQAIKTSDIDRLLKKLVKREYTDTDAKTFQTLDRPVLIVDDVDQIGLNRKHLGTFFKNAKEKFDHIILLADEAFEYVASEIPHLGGLTMFSILPYGNSKRSELIRRWAEIGVAETIKENDLFARIDALRTHVNSFVRRNIVPSKPIYLLTILQSFESYSPLGFEMTSYGHCYQHLIYRALEKAKIRPTDQDSYINYLTELAGELFEVGTSKLSTTEFVSFCEKYKTQFIGTDPLTIHAVLCEHSVLISSDQSTRFKYRYIYYFYAAKFLSDRMSKSPESKEQIHGLVAELHKEECANIMIFITHHTRDPWILDEIQLSMMELFDDCKEASLEADDLDFMQEFLEDLPQLIVEQREIENERQQDDRRRDREEAGEERFEKSVERLDPQTLLARVNRAFKGIEIIGQIIRNRHGSLERDRLVTLLTESYTVGLRFLQSFLEFSNVAKGEILQSIQHMLISNPNIDDDVLEKRSRRLYLLMTYGIIYGVIRKVAFSVGARETESIHAELESQMGTPAVKLINQTVALQFLKKLDTSSIEDLSLEFADNGVCKRILSEIVVQHMYMHQVDFAEKQKIAEILGIPLERQIRIEGKKGQQE